MFKQKRITRIVVLVVLIAALGGISYWVYNNNFITRTLALSEEMGASDTDSLLLSVERATKNEDNDELNDYWEHKAALYYAPYLIFDENEPDSAVNNMRTLYQVHQKSSKEIVITYVFLFEYDYGWDTPHSNWGCGYIPDLFGEIAKIIDRFTDVPIEELTSKHCGDTERVKIYLEKKSNNRWGIKAVRLYRHGENTYYSWANKKLNGWPAYQKTHIKVYVSEDKHGLYRSDDECEDFSKVVIKIKYWRNCVITVEDCSGGKKMLATFPESHNVGENTQYGKRYSTVGQISTDMYNLYRNEPIWTGSEFCGGWERSDCNKYFPENCGGGLVNKWE